MKEMFRSYLDVAAKYKACALMGGLDYRASPDWGRLLGYSREGLAEANIQSIEFLRDLAKEYASEIPEILIQGLIGPRGDAYERNEAITENEAEDYHSVQLESQCRFRAGHYIQQCHGVNRCGAGCCQNRRAIGDFSHIG